MADYLVTSIVAWLLTHIGASFAQMWKLLSATVFANPDVTVLPQVKSLSDNSLTIVNTCFVLALLAAGVMVMGQHTIQTSYGVNELLPRLVIGFIAANFATPLCSQIIRFSNTLTAAVTGGQVDDGAAFNRLLDIMTGASQGHGEAVLLLILVGMVAGLTGMLLVSCVVRLGVLVALVGIAPLALACHATPFTEPAAKLWWRSFAGLLAIVTLQALALHITMIIFWDPNANLGALGLPMDPTGVLNLFIVVCLLFVTIKIPGLMRRFVTQGGGGRNIAGMFVRMVVVQQLTGLLRLPLRGGGKAASAGAAGRRATRGRAAARAWPDASGAVIPYWKPRMPRPTARTTPAPSAGAPAGQQGPLVPPGVNPATAMPQKRPAWRGRSGTSTPRPLVPPGVNPATAMPRTRPAWRGATPHPSTPPPPNPVVPPGVHPGTAMPRTRPAWQTPRPRPGSGGSVSPRRPRL